METSEMAIQESYRLMKKYEIHARKRFGQNFLTDYRVLDKIIDASQVCADDFVLEIGPGLGTLTRCLCEKAGQVLAVEIDYDLADILNSELSEIKNLQIVQGDILKTDVSDIIRKYAAGRKIKVVANLPYYVTTPIIMGLFEGDVSLGGVPMESVTVMVQSEVAKRMMAKPGEKECGAISLSVQYYAEAYLAANVPPNCFRPRPKVSSAVVRLSCLEEPPVHTEDRSLMFALIKAAFSKRRKTLVNAISGSSELDIQKEVVADAILKTGLSETVRGEKLSLEDYARLADELSVHSNIQ